MYKAFSNVWKCKLWRDACLQLLYTDNINVWLHMDVQKTPYPDQNKYQTNKQKTNSALEVDA